MKQFSILTAVSVACASLWALPAVAQDVVLGKAEFEERCSVCHGITGKGDGIVGELFAQKPRNLTTLAKENGGVFPFEAVYQAIDGRREIRGHGTTRMPVWGEYLMVEALEDRFIDKKDAYLVVQGRILALVYYLQSVQSP